MPATLAKDCVMRGIMGVAAQRNVVPVLIKG